MAENGAETAKNSLFWFFGRGAVGIGMRGIFFDWDCSPDAELQTYVGFFKTPLTGRGQWPSLQAFGVLPDMLKVRINIAEIYQ